MTKKIVDKYLILLLVILIEGAFVMEVELLGAKLISPFYGNSFKMWTAVITISILALTIGYFIGGFLSKRQKKLEILSFLLLFSGIWIGLMPKLSHALIELNLEMDLFTGAIRTSIFLLVIPIVLLSSTTPLVTQLFSDAEKNGAQAVGKVFALSTLGGVVSTIILGFYVVPLFGLSIVFVSSAIILLALSLFIKRGIVNYFLFGIGVILVFNYNSFSADISEKFGNSEFLSIEEGMMGQLKVLEDRYPQVDTSYRTLIINGIPQTIIINDEHASSFWNYVHKISALSTLKRNKDAVLFGMGGGSIASELTKMGLNSLTIVDVDARMYDISEKYFYFKKGNSNLVVDDARHFIKTATRKFDLAVFDVCSGEVQPSNVFTIEGISDLDEILNGDAIVLIQYQELTNESKKSGSQSLCKTFNKAGYHTYVDIEKGEIDNIIIVASKKYVNFKNVRKENLNRNDSIQPWMDAFLSNLPKKADTKRGVLLCDDKPQLEILNEETIMHWRNNINLHYNIPNIRQKTVFVK